MSIISRTKDGMLLNHSSVGRDQQLSEGYINWGQGTFAYTIAHNISIQTWPSEQDEHMLGRIEAASCCLNLASPVISGGWSGGAI